MIAARLVPDSAESGPLNMALDAVLLAWAEASGQPVVRVYGWAEPTTSLGYFQPLADRQSHPPSQPTAVVRRETGGGAIVHHHDLTYSLAVPKGLWSALPPAELYCRVHGTLRDTLAEQCGLAAELCRCGTADGPAAPFLCFQRRASGDLLVGEAKIAGSAQRRPRTAVLQHGSLLVARSPHAPELPGVVDLTPAGHRPWDRAAFIDAWLARLAVALGLDFQPQPLTPAEHAAAAVIASERFAHADWTARR